MRTHFSIRIGFGLSLWQPQQDGPAQLFAVALLRGTPLQDFHTLSAPLANTQPATLAAALRPLFISLQLVGAVPPEYIPPPPEINKQEQSVRL